MILVQPQSPARRRSAFTLLEVLVVVAIILVLASVATVAVLQVQKENKNDIAKIQAISLQKALQTYIIKNEGNPPNSLQDIIRYIDGGDVSKLTDPWGNQFQMGSTQNNDVTSYYIHTSNPETGAEIRSDTKK
ncbi:prepilin-type N-terminal cleavage/methylation domain-containing protein [Zavarzinella formosa]|uniref:prepilin-type N-terminal cleavage/methylation domain-containing protein n=1 Tax=Zavarzinella formosa TaxID=360055 RepID=UPI0002EBA951|nr:prepilin-type N-terminal cleavage/methylation domain-containing protein [Zavarzinella formosa]